MIPVQIKWPVPIFLPVYMHLTTPAAPVNTAYKPIKK